MPKPTQLPFQFDHCNCYVKDCVSQKYLKSIGFTWDPKTVEHPATKQCTFVVFQTPASHRGPNFGLQYFEFCHIRDVDRELAYYRSKPGGSDGQIEDLFLPGFSLRSSSSLDKVFEQHLSSLEMFSPKLSHKNYDWQKGQDSRRPGWNFLTFQKSPVKGANIWVTEYEKRVGEDADKRKKDSLEFTVHKNGVHSILGFVWDLDPVEESNLATTLGLELVNGVGRLSDGTVHFSKKSAVGLSTLSSKPHQSLASVIFTCDSLAQFEKVSAINQTQVLGEAAVVIPMPQNCWDIVVVERRKGELLTR